jgi:hypothetical protein
MLKEGIYQNKILTAAPSNHSGQLAQAQVVRDFWNKADGGAYAIQLTV